MKISTIPQEQAASGFVQDLNAEIDETASRLGLAVTYLMHDGDVYIAVRVPNKEELADLDALTDALESASAL